MSPTPHLTVARTDLYSIAPFSIISIAISMTVVYLFSKLGTTRATTSEKWQMIEDLSAKFTVTFLATTVALSFIKIKHTI